MDPVSLTVASMAMTAGGGATQAYGQAQAGKSSNQMYQYRAAVFDVNRQIAEQNADYAIKVGETQAQQAGMEGRHKVGGIIAKAGASGFDVNTGSKSRVVESVQEIATHNQAVIRSDAAKRAYDHRVQAYEATTQGQIYRRAGADAESAGKINALGTILGTAGSVGSKWLDAKQRGIFGGSGSGIEEYPGAHA